MLAHSRRFRPIPARIAPDAPRIDDPTFQRVSRRLHPFVDSGGQRQMYIMDTCTVISNSQDFCCSPLTCARQSYIIGCQNSADNERSELVASTYTSREQLLSLRNQLQAELADLDRRLNILLNTRSRSGWQELGARRNFVAHKLHSVDLALTD